MFGYVVTEKGELRVREADIYQAYYCGLCKSVSKRLGQIPRFTLNFDSVFLALVLGSLSDEKDNVRREHCFVHPFEKKPVERNSEAVDYAADVMVILGYHKFMDDWKDEHSAAGLAGITVLKSAYGKLYDRHRDLCEKIEDGLSRLSEEEGKNSGQLDIVADIFGDIMEALFTGFYEDEKLNMVLGRMGRFLGRWIYVIDALDDYEDDVKTGSYNPLIYRKNKLEGIDLLLYNYLAEAVNAYDLLDVKKNKGIIDNILFLGLRGKMEAIIRERTKHNE